MTRFAFFHRRPLTTLAFAQVAPDDARAGDPAGAKRARPQRHGGGAGEPRRPHRRRDPRPRRQRGRCRGGDRLCARGHLSARRQYRRRRLHGDPSRQRQPRHDNRLSRDRAGGRDADHVPRRARQSRPGEVARLRARGRRARHRRRAGPGAGEIRLRQIHARRSDRARDRPRAGGLSGRGRSCRFAARRARAARHAGRRRRRSSSTAATCRTKATG